MSPSPEPTPAQTSTLVLPSPEPTPVPTEILFQTDEIAPEPQIFSPPSETEIFTPLIIPSTAALIPHLEPSITAASEPSITAASEPSITAASEPSIIAAPEPSITAAPEPSITERISWSQAADRLRLIDNDLQIHLGEVSALIASLNSNFENLIATFESEVDIYFSDFYEARSQKLPFLKFREYLNDISLPKSSSGLWETSWNGKEAVPFVFRTVGGKPQIAEKLSFRSIIRHDCLTKEFFISLQVGKTPEITSRVFVLEPWKNVSLPFPITFDTLKVIALSNRGNATAICLPDFRVYRRLGFTTL
jgi:hypothetical protein